MCLCLCLDTLHGRIAACSGAVGLPSRVKLRAQAKLQPGCNVTNVICDRAIPVYRCLCTTRSVLFLYASTLGCRRIWEYADR